jgi:hypothetical protein
VDFNYLVLRVLVLAVIVLASASMIGANAGVSEAKRLALPLETSPTGCPDGSTAKTTVVLTVLLYMLYWYCTTTVLASK